MKIFVAGASGALGIPAVRVLRARGHDVLGSTRSTARARSIEAAGGKAVILDAMDREATRCVLAEVRPDAVVDLLTALPKSGPRRASDMRTTNLTRTVASGHLLEAAIAAGAGRYIAESFFLVYGSGDLGRDALTEEVEVPVRVAHPQLRDTIEAMRTKEARALDAAAQGRIEAIVMRFGGFYGAGAGLEQLVHLLRKRLLPVVSSPHATPWVEIGDAAAAVAAGVDRGRSGEIYNVVDDEPVPMSTLFTAIAAAAGAPRPFAVPRFVLALAAPYLKAVLVESHVPLSNRKARTELGWTPSHPRAVEAMRQLVA